MRNRVCACIMLIIVCTFAQSDINPAKRAKIEKFLIITGSLKIGDMFAIEVVGQMNETYKKNGTPVKDSILKIMENEVSTLAEKEMRAKSGLVDQLCRVYNKYYSDKDLDELIRFYSTETGKKVTATLPFVMQESMTIGQQWSHKVGPGILSKLQQRMLEKGVKLPKI